MPIWISIYVGFVVFELAFAWWMALPMAQVLISIAFGTLIGVLIRWWHSDPHEARQQEAAYLARKSDEYLNAPRRARDRAIWNIIRNAQRKRK